MRVDILLSDPRAIFALRKALEPSHARVGPFLIQPVLSWTELEKRSEAGAFDLAFVQPDFPEGGQAGKLNMFSLERVRAMAGAARLILFVCNNGCGAGSIEDLRRYRFPFVMIQGVDDDPRSVLRLMARAQTLENLDLHLSGRKALRELTESEFFLLPLVGWPPPESVPDLARRLGVSPRTLRRRMADLGLLTPRDMIRWGRLLEGFALWKMGMKSRTRMASVLGTGGHSSIARLCRELTGQNLGRLFHSSADGEVFRAFLEGFAPPATPRSGPGPGSDASPGPPGTDPERKCG